MKTKIALIYHKADVDGLASAALMELVFRNLNSFGNKLEYNLIGYNYGTDTNENPWLTNKEYTEYYFVDVTPPIGWLEINLEKIKSGKIRINIFDHHEPIMKEIEKLECIEYLNYFFNKDMCGAMIFYSTIQDFLNYIYDIDLSSLKPLLKSKEVYEKLVLISAYDTWEFDSWTDRKKQVSCIGFTTYLSMFLGDVKLFFDKFFETSFTNIMAGGMLLTEQKLAEADRLISNGYYSKKSKTFIIQGLSSWFITKKVIDSYPDCEKIIYFEIKLNKPSIQVKLSCRACVQDSFDCVDYLKKCCDGNFGGHYNASGGLMSLKIFNQYLETLLD